jgi:hypothetical protein
VAGIPFTSKSVALTPVTGSLKVTWIWISALTVAPASGFCAATTGAWGFSSVYCQVAPGALASKEWGRALVSVMPWFAAQVMATLP